MGVEEGVFMEVLYGLNDRAIQTAAQGLLRATLVCDQRLKHGSHHVQLQRDKIFLDDTRKCLLDSCYVVHKQYICERISSV